MCRPEQTAVLALSSEGSDGCVDLSRQRSLASAVRGWVYVDLSSQRSLARCCMWAGRIINPLFTLTSAPDNSVWEHKAQAWDLREIT